MAHLFSPLTIAGKRLINRVVMAPFPSGHTSTDGFVSRALYAYYVRRAHGGVGLIMTEPALVVPPVLETSQPHLGLYDDAFVPALRNMVQSVHGAGTRVIPILDAPTELAQISQPEMQALGENFIRAAWRALAAGCDGIALSAADNGLLHTLVSPLTNQRTDIYGGSVMNRLRLPIEIIEGIQDWLGTRLLVAFRLVAEEFAPDGISLHDARVTARRLVAAGVNLLDVTTDSRSEVPVAHFPGWRVPLADGIKRMLPEVPITTSGLLGDPYLADSVVRDGSVDLVMLGSALRENPYWAHIARIILASKNGTLCES